MKTMLLMFAFVFLFVMVAGFSLGILKMGGWAARYLPPAQPQQELAAESTDQPVAPPPVSTPTPEHHDFSLPPSQPAPPTHQTPRYDQPPMQPMPPTHQTPRYDQPPKQPSPAPAGQTTSVAATDSQTSAAPTWADLQGMLDGILGKQQ